MPRTRKLSTQNGRPTVYKLGQAATPDIVFELRGREYAVASDPDIDIVVAMLRLQQDIAEGDENAVAEAVIAARDLVLELIRERDPKVKSIRIGIGELMELFALITGGASVASETAQDLAKLAAAAPVE